MRNCVLLFLFLLMAFRTEAKQLIYVYNGPGTSQESINNTYKTFHDLLKHKYSIKLINDLGINNKDWTRNSALLIIPGGADLPYIKYINYKIIKKYVEDGGKFLGICAGAYWASSSIKFDDNGKFIEGPRDLKFFKDMAIGPLVPYDVDSCAGCRAMEIQVEKCEANNILCEDKGANSFFVYYNGGSYFKDAEKYPDTHIIAKYKDLNLPAIISMNVKSGKAVLSGVHFEYNPNMLNENDVNLKFILPILYNDNNQRIELAKLIIDELAL